MTTRSYEEIDAFARSLKAGDKVAIYESPWHDQEIYTALVERITPTGRIVLRMGSTFKPNGFKYGDKVYARRYVRKPRDGQEEA